MKPIESRHLIALIGVLALAFAGCSSNSSKPTAQQSSQQYEAPQTTASEPDNKLFLQALKAQNEGQFESAIQLWNDYLVKQPDSFEGHNNLGLVYYSQDMVSQALQEFETAHQLQPYDPKIRTNLVRALRFKATMLQENREYFKTLEIFARLENLVEPEEKQGILFKQEQVEDQIFLQVIEANNSAAYQDFVNRFPDGLNAVRAREYLDKHPHKVAKSVSKSKSWISSGKKDSSGGSSWASSEQPPDYSSSRPTATYTPPPAGASQKTGDFFGSDSAAVEKAPEEDLNAVQDPVAAIPFEDFDKPERSSGEQATTKAPEDGKESRTAANDSNPISDAPDEVAVLDTLPDLTPSPVAELPAEADTPQPDDLLAGDIEMKPAEQETTEAAATSVEEAVEQATPETETPSMEETVEPVTQQEEPTVEASVAESADSENEKLAQALKEDIPSAESVQPEQAQPAPPEPAEVMEAEPEASAVEAEANVNQEAVTPESVESESERIARAVREEIANSESDSAEQIHAEISKEMATEPEPSQEDAPLEIAAFDPLNEGAQPESVPVESAPAEEPAVAVDEPEKTAISQETISETVAALLPTPPSPQAVEAETMDSSNTMVVVQMNPGSTLNVRAKPSGQGEILGYLENGDMMPFMSESGDWYQISIEDDLSGWVSKNYSTTRSVAPEAPSPVPDDDMTSELAFDQPEPSEQQAPDAMVVVTISEDATLNVRSLPSSSGAVVDMLFQGDKLPLIKEEGEWYQVQFEDETTGWVSKKFTRLEGGTKPVSFEIPEETKPTPQTSAHPSDEMVTTVVVIKVPEGTSLNVRSSPSPQGDVMGSLKRGDMRPLLEESGEWYQVELPDGQSGWVSQKFSGKMNLDSSFIQNP